MLQPRKIVIERDRETLLELHCCINYASETPYARRMPFAEYRQKWLGTSQPGTYLAELAATMQDERTVAEIWEDDGAVVGYLWMRFQDLPDYGLTIAEVMDIGVVEEYRGRGIGRRMLRYAEVVARKRGATLLRSDAGTENAASQRLHGRMGFRPYRIVYEKVLRHEPSGRPVAPERFAAALDEARLLLRHHGFDHDVSWEDLRAYAEADLFYPSAISWDEILSSPLITAHEVVEVAELRRVGLPITRDVIVANVDEVYQAHLVASEVEMAIAQAIGDVAHIRRRLEAVQDWITDPLLPDGLRERYTVLVAQVQEVLHQEEQGTLTTAERSLLERELSWCRAWEVIKTAPGRKLLRVTTPDMGDFHYTLMSDPLPRLVAHEPVRFVVTVQSARGPCRAGHQVGDRWEFDWGTPAGLCGSAYHTMYPVLHGLMLGGGCYEGPAAQETLVSCPDEGWLTFRIERQRWTPEMWTEGS